MAQLDADVSHGGRPRRFLANMAGMSDAIHITCPKCNAVLQPVEAAEIKADVCPGCGGVWLDRGELEQLYGTWGIVEIDRASKGQRAVPPSTPAVDLCCPSCTATLLTLEVAGVALDGCPGCGGLWLDRGELGPALDAVGSHGDPRRLQRLSRAVANKRGG